MAKTFIAFYSRADENYVGGALKMLSVGNTQIAAETIQRLTDGDIFQIEQETPYSKNYNTCIEEARVHQRENARPTLTAYPESMADYDVIYLCYPNYWSTVPMAVFTFLEHFDFSGKEIRPLCTHEGSGLGSSVRDIQKLCLNATVRQGLAVRGGNVQSAEADIKSWIDSFKQ